MFIIMNIKVYLIFNEITLLIYQKQKYRMCIQHLTKDKFVTNWRCLFMFTPVLHVMMLAAADKNKTFYKKGYNQIKKQQLSDQLGT